MVRRKATPRCLMDLPLFAEARFAEAKHRVPVLSTPIICSAMAYDDSSHLAGEMSSNEYGHDAWKAKGGITPDEAMAYAAWRIKRGDRKEDLPENKKLMAILHADKELCNGCMRTFIRDSLSDLVKENKVRGVRNDFVTTWAQMEAEFTDPDTVTYHIVETVHRMLYFLLPATEASSRAAAIKHVQKELGFTIVTEEGVTGKCFLDATYTQQRTRLRAVFQKKSRGKKGHPYGIGTSCANGNYAGVVNNQIQELPTSKKRVPGLVYPHFIDYNFWRHLIGTKQQKEAADQWRKHGGNPEKDFGYRSIELAFDRMPMMPQETGELTGSGPATIEMSQQPSVEVAVTGSQQGTCTSASRVSTGSFSSRCKSSCLAEYDDDESSDSSLTNSGGSATELKETRRSELRLRAKKTGTVSYL